MIKKYLFLQITLLLTLLSGCTNEVTWSSFNWVEYSNGNQHFDKAAIFMPITLKGSKEEYFVQLDTGASSTLYGNIFNDMKSEYHLIKKKNKLPLVVSIDGNLANYQFKNKNISILQNVGPSLEELRTTPYKKIGNIGIDFFQGRILILDFPKKRFSIVKSYHDIPNSIKQNSTFVDFQIEQNKLFFNTKMGNKNLYLFYDSGASFFDIVTTRELWSEVMGWNNEKDIKEIQIPSWGETARLRGAKIKNDWTLGGFTVKEPLVYYEDSGLNNLNFKNYPYPVDGLFGNAIFYDHYVLTIDLINNKLGIMKVEI